LSEVKNAVRQMDQMSQQNAAVVEQSTAASRVMADQTQQLSHLIARFKIGDDRADESGSARGSRSRRAA